MNKKWIFIALLGLTVLTGCSLPNSAPPPTPTVIIIPAKTQAILLQALNITPTVVPTSTLAPLLPGTPVSASSFCADGQAPALITSLKTALQTSNGTLLASLVHPTHGMEVRYYRDGRIVKYDQEHAKFLFGSTFQVNWGNSFGSGQPTIGAFHQVVLPALLKVFNTNYTLTCNQVQVGGASYPTTWPYSGINYYSVYFPGTPANSNLDWHTWLVGVEYVGSKPYLYALMQFEWEP